MPHFPDAACKGKTALFFAPAREDHYARIRREVKAHAVCIECPALIACRTWAREHHEAGYWGAESEEQRIAAGYRNAAADPAVARRASTG